MTQRHLRLQSRKTLMSHLRQVKRRVREIDDLPPWSTFLILCVVNVYPESLQVFHAGTLPTVYVGFAKVSSIFFFGWACLGVAPAVYFEPNGGLAMTLAGTTPSDTRSRSRRRADQS